MQSRRVITDHEKRVVAYHEAGHALCSELLPSVEKVHRISIIPRGQALGYTLNLPEEDRYLKTKEELMDYLVVLLGGRVTEHLVFGQITTGASDDLKKVHEISHSMVTEYGMGTRAAVQAAARRRLLDVRRHPAAWWTRSSSSSPTRPTAARSSMVSEHRALLEAFARTLLENEVLERDDIERLVAEHEGTRPARAGSSRCSEPTATATARRRPRSVASAPRRLRAPNPG